MVMLVEHESGGGAARGSVSAYMVAVSKQKMVSSTLLACTPRRWGARWRCGLQQRGCTRGGMQGPNSPHPV